MRIEKPRVVSPDEVHLRRDGEHAILDYADPSYGGIDLRVGPNIEMMTDEERTGCIAHPGGRGPDAPTASWWGYRFTYDCDRGRDGAPGIRALSRGRSRC